MVDCDCSSRSAMRARRRDIGTRCSGRSPYCATRRLDGGQRAARVPRGARPVPASPLQAPPSARRRRPLPARAGGALSASSTSPLVTRPSLPVPGTEPTARSLLGHQLGRRRHRDVALGLGERGRPGGETPGVSPGAGSAGGMLLTAARRRPPGLGVDLGDHLVGDAAVAVVLDDLRQHAGGRRRHLEHDLVGLDLDQDLVDRRPLRPGFFFHCSSVASATDSDSCGTLTSRSVPFSFCGLRRVRLSRVVVTWSGRSP